MSDSMKQRLDAIRLRMAQACERVGRDVADVHLLAVSKTFDANAVREAAALGLNAFGESRLQELRDKLPQLSDLDLRWVLIGHLQTNKAKDAARWVHEVQSLDRLALAEVLHRRLQDEGRSIDVLVQVKTSPEPSKFGLEPVDLPDFLDALKGFPTLRVKGLMTLAINSDDEHAVRGCFRRLRQLRDEAQAIGHHDVKRLSMGMTGDFEWAIEEGATDIRIGSALFGVRDYAQH
ncbi:YggS family pyridoxal phosphate-dependent enzyme [Pusillimonas sp. NJUB218]|uniref:YggS family pyridoxal phosphate-dependent enzyme n=1 Tax=Pusillimonas sp. NJUB218 TaxID=2023230 RepID=UPI000F4AFF6C|nr:YggS family pyridoxal phosphate-dependent enzyme [Pusillimonas sp. NJUB218]ROT44935.1 YggS family pyridoxal phosphate-dependent enzyme [Pusillimonas sp. NJUB218]